MTRTRSTRLRQLCAAGLAVLLGAAGCAGRTSPEPPAETATGTPPAVRFSSEIEVREQALHIRYELVNASGGDLVVLNRVPAYSPAGTPTDDPAAVYVTGGDEPGRVEIAKRAFPMPKTDRMSWAQAPWISGVIVGDGAQVGEELTVPLPLRRHHPYGDDVGDGPIGLPDPVTEVVFCLGVLRRAEAPVPAESPTGTAEPPVVTLPHLSATTAVQHLSCSPPVRL